MGLPHASANKLKCKAIANDILIWSENHVLLRLWLHAQVQACNEAWGCGDR